MLLQVENLPLCVLCGCVCVCAGFLQLLSLEFSLGLRFMFFVADFDNGRIPASSCV